MPTVKGGAGHGSGQRNSSSYQTKSEIQKTTSPSKARDDLYGAFAGEQNEAKDDSNEQSTNLKSRKTKASADKTHKL